MHCKVSAGCGGSSFALAIVLKWGQIGGEEVSVSLGYALRTMDRLTPPIRVSKTEAPP